MTGPETGLWTNVSFAQDDTPHSSGVFRSGAERLAQKGNWVRYVMNGSNPKTGRHVTPVYAR
jgi:hypothetical protein